MSEIRRQEEQAEIEQQTPEQSETVLETSEAKNETELSSEVIEKIMEKVQDIDKKGLAYSQSDYDNLPGILKDGLLGQESYNRPGGKKEGYKKRFGKEWAENTHKTKDAFVHFNIIGRGRDLLGEKGLEIGRSYLGMPPNTIAIVFDIKNYEEVQQNYGAQEGKSHTFLNHDPNKRGEKLGVSIPDTEFGFVLSFRVAPRLFQGIVLSPGRNMTNTEIEMKIRGDEREKQKYGYSYDEEYNRARYKKDKIADDDYSPYIKEIVESMKEVNETKPERLIPIYDADGNLLWPEQMSYEEVKKYVAERDIKNNEAKNI